LQKNGRRKTWQENMRHPASKQESSKRKGRTPGADLTGRVNNNREKKRKKAHNSVSAPKVHQTWGRTSGFRREASTARNSIGKGQDQRNHKASSRLREGGASTSAKSANRPQKLTRKKDGGKRRFMQGGTIWQTTGPSVVVSNCAGGGRNPMKI